MRKAVNEVKKAVKEMKGLSSDIFEKVDTKKMASQVATATKKAKKQLESLGLADIGDTSSMKINGIGRQITGISNKFKQLRGQRGVLGDVFDAQRFKQQAEEISKSTNKVKESISSFKNYNSNDIQGFINNYTAKTGNSKKSKIDVNTADVKKAKAELEKLNSNINKTNNNKIKVGTSKELQKSNTFANRLKNAIQQVKKQMDSSGSSSKKISNGLSSAKNMASKMGGSLKVGLGQILKISGALFGLQTIYSTLTNVANTWLSSQNSQAKQLSANIDYMKYALGSTLAPVIQWIVNRIYQALKGVQSLIYALTGVNIFANASAKAYSNMAGSAKKAKEETKQLSGIHSEIDNIQDNNSSDSGNGAGDVAPNIDLSNIDGKLMPWAEKVKGVLFKLFEPMRNAWANHGQALMDSIKNSASKIKELFGAVGKSFSEVWLNGTGERICSTILQIITTISDTIGIIAEKWKNAWEKDNNGTQIIQNLADAFSNVLDIVLSVYDTYKEWWKTEQAQNFVNAIVKGFEIISSVIEKATEIIKNIWEGAGRDTFTSLLDAVSKAIEFIVVLCDTLEPFVTSMMEAVAPAIELIVKLIGDWLGIIGGLLDFWIGVFTGDWSRAWEGIKSTVENELKLIGDAIKLAYEFIVAIPGKIAEKVSKAAEELGRKVGEKIAEIRDDFVNKFNEMKDKAKEKVDEIKTNVVNKFIEMKDKAVNKVTEIKDGIRNKFQEAYNGIRNIFGNIGSFFSNVWGNVKNTFSNLGTSIGNAISNSVKSGINGVISMIQNTINRAIGIINGAIRLINKLPGVSVSTVSALSLPRLAKGGVLYDETAFIGGEYSGARSNPEIVTPQNLMYDTMRRALSDSDIGSSDDRPINLAIYVGNTKVGQILLDNLRDMKRKSGKDIEALIGG